MKKKVYAKPTLIGEEFVPNEYVAACEGVVTWTINCNVPNGYGYIDNNNNGRYDKKIDTLLTPTTWIGQPEIVRGCNQKHQNIILAPGETPYDKNAMWHPSGGGSDYPVFYWRDGNGKNDVHFTKGDASDIQKNMS